MHTIIPTNSGNLELYDKNLKKNINFVITMEIEIENIILFLNDN